MTVKADKKSRSGTEQLFPALLFFPDIFSTFKHSPEKRQCQREPLAAEYNYSRRIGHDRKYTKTVSTGLFIRIPPVEFLYSKSKPVIWNSHFHFSPARNAKDAIHAVHNGRTHSSTLNFPL